MCPRHCRCPQHQEHAPNPINTSAGSGAPCGQKPTGCGCPGLAAGPQVIRSFICRKRTQQLRCGRTNPPAAALIKTQDRRAPENRDLAELSRSTGHQLNIYPSAQRSTLCMEGRVGNRRGQAPPIWHSQLPVPPGSGPSVPRLHGCPERGHSGMYPPMPGPRLRRGAPGGKQPQPAQSGPARSSQAPTSCFISRAGYRNSQCTVQARSPAAAQAARWAKRLNPKLGHGDFCSSTCPWESRDSPKITASSLTVPHAYGNICILNHILAQPVIRATQIAPASHVN